MDWPLLDTLGDEERRAILRLARRHRYSRGDFVVREGDPSDSVHLVASGRLAIRVSTVDGEHRTVNLVGPGDYFGELSLLDGQAPVRSASVVALGRCETFSLSAAQFHDLREHHPAADRLIMSLMARRIEELSGRLLEATYDGLDRRLHRRLAELTALYDEGTVPVVVPLTQETLAELVGGTRQSVNQVLQRLVDRGVVRLTRGRVHVLDQRWLRVRVG